MVRTLTVVMVFQCGMLSIVAQESDWTGAFQNESVQRYFLALEPPPGDAVEWVSGKGRYYGLKQDLINKVAPDIAGKHSKESFAWAQEVLQEADPDPVKYVFALAVMASRDGALLEPSVSSLELLKIKDPLDRIRATMRATPPLMRAAQTYSPASQLAQNLYDFLKNGTMSWPAKLQLADEDAELYRAGLRSKLTEAELERIRSSIVDAERSKDARAELMGRRVLFHQTANLAILSDAVEKGGTVGQGVVRSLGELSHFPEATEFLLRRARQYEFARLDNVDGVDPHFAILQALRKHDATEVTDCLRNLLANPNQYHTPACLGSISWALHSREGSRKAKQGLANFWGSRVTLFVQISEWIEQE